VSEYVVIFERAEDGGWGADLPDLPGVAALGDTWAEVGDRIQEALEAYADELRSLGRDLPRPFHAVGTPALDAGCAWSRSLGSHASLP
jgi:predicted RNase H-like HicB family nuclease